MEPHLGFYSHYQFIFLFPFIDNYMFIHQERRKSYDQEELENSLV